MVVDLKPSQDSIKKNCAFSQFLNRLPQQSPTHSLYGFQSISRWTSLKSKLSSSLKVGNFVKPAWKENPATPTPRRHKENIPEKKTKKRRVGETFSKLKDSSANHGAQLSRFLAFLRAHYWINKISQFAISCTFT